MSVTGGLAAAVLGDHWLSQVNSPLYLGGHRQLSMRLAEVELGACSLQAAQAALEARNARYRVGPGRQSSDEEDAPDRVKDRLEQAERAVEKFVTRRLKAVQPGLEKVSHQNPKK